MKRRYILFLGCTLPFIAHAQPAGAAIALEALVKILGDAGEALSKFTKGITDAVKAGAQGYDYLAAKRDRDRLIDISARMTTLINQKSVEVVNGIERYLDIATDRPSMAEAEWGILIDTLRGTLSSVRELLEDVKKTRSDFVADDAYDRLVETLNSRGLALSNLTGIAAPVSKQELEILSRANHNYRVLLAQAKEATRQLNRYIREHDQKK